MAKIKKQLTISQLRVAGFEVLVNELGYVNALKFIHQYDLGHGDYTKVRRKVFYDKSLKEIIREVEEYRKSK